MMRHENGIMSRQNAPAAVRWTAYVAVAIVFAIACAFLANWQFTRNSARADQLALIDANFDARPAPLGDVLPAGTEFDPSDEWLPVVLTGEYLPEDQLLVRNRPHGGTAAFEVLVPFRLDDGRVLLVNRGWVRPGIDQPDPDVVPAPPAGEVTAIVRLRPSEPLPSSGRSAPEGQVPTVSLRLIADMVGPASEGLDTSAFGILQSEDPAPSTSPALLEPPSADPGPHLSYAIQWILFAVMGFIFIGYVIRTELRYRREDAEDRAAGQLPPRVRRPVRKADQDMQDEDSLLDAAGR